MVDLVGANRIDQLDVITRQALDAHICAALDDANLSFDNFVYAGGRVIGWSITDSDIDFIVYDNSATLQTEKNLLPVDDFMGKKMCGIYRHPDRALVKHGIGGFLLPKLSRTMVLIDHDTDDLQAWYEECRAFRITFGQRDFSNCIQVFND